MGDRFNRWVARNFGTIIVVVALATCAFYVGAAFGDLADSIQDQTRAVRCNSAILVIPQDDRATDPAVRLCLSR